MSVFKFARKIIMYADLNVPVQDSSTNKEILQFLADCKLGKNCNSECLKCRTCLSVCLYMYPLSCVIYCTHAPEAQLLSLIHLLCSADQE